MGHLVRKAQLLHSRRGVAAADDGDRAALGHCAGHADGAGREVLPLRNAHGAVPNHGARALNGAREQLDGLGTNVQAHPAVGNGGGVYHLALGLGVKLLAHLGVNGQQELHASLLGLFQGGLGQVDLVLLAQGGADAVALGLKEGVGHAAADDQGVNLCEQVVNNADFVGNLGAAQNGHKGTLGLGEGSAHHGDLLLNQVAAHSGQIVGNALGGGMGPVGGAESIVDVDIRHRGQLFGKGGVILGLLRMEADVLNNHHIAIVEGGGLLLGVGAHNVLGHNDLFAQQLAKLCGHRGQGELLHIALRGFQSLGGGLGLLGLGHGVDLLLLLLVQLHGLVEDVVGTAHVGAEDDLGAMVREVLYGGQRAHDALGVSNGSVLHGDVEVAADQNPLAGNVDVFHSLLVEIVHVRALLYLEHKLGGKRGASQKISSYYQILYNKTRLFASITLRKQPRPVIFSAGSPVVRGVCLR